MDTHIVREIAEVELEVVRCVEHPHCHRFLYAQFLWQGSAAISSHGHILPDSRTTDTHLIDREVLNMERSQSAST